MNEEASLSSLSPYRWKYIVPGALALAVLVLGVLYAFPPDQHGFYPRCLLKSMTGWDCPGCGGLRAAHHFLHGRVEEAIRLNPFLVLAGFWAGALGLVEVYRWKKGGAFQNPLLRAGVLWTMTILMILFGIVRNLPRAF